MKQDQWFVKPKTGLDISGNGLINLITFCVLCFVFQQILNSLEESLLLQELLFCVWCCYNLTADCGQSEVM